MKNNFPAEEKKLNRKQMVCVNEVMNKPHKYFYNSLKR